MLSYIVYKHCCTIFCVYPIGSANKKKNQEKKLSWNLFIMKGNRKEETVPKFSFFGLFKPMQICSGAWEYLIINEM